VLDSGNPGYEYDSAEFRYGTSPAAHATICIDGFDWAKEAPPYGSGIVASTQTGNLNALLTRNPSAASGGGAARRVLVYQPRRFLLVFDDVVTYRHRKLVRTLPLAPGLRATRGQAGSVEIGDEASTLARLTQVRVPGVEPDEVELSIGVRAPRMRGFSFPSPDDPVPSCDITLVGPAGQSKAYALLLDRAGAGAPEMTCVASGGSVCAEITGLADGCLTLRFDDESLSVAI
jgi:hypothetical protein